MTVTVEYDARIALLPDGNRGVAVSRTVCAKGVEVSRVEIMMDVEDTLAMVRFSRMPWASFEVEDFADPDKRMYFHTTSPTSEQGEMAWIPGKDMDRIYDSPDSDWFPLLMDEAEQVATEARR